jgi:hypothetical protein
MKKFHICFILAAEVCTGVNIIAKDYIEAIKNFNSLHGNKEIVYVSAMND